MCQRVLVNKVSGIRLATLLKKNSLTQGFSWNLAKFLRTPLFTEHLRWLLLILQRVKSRTRMFNAFYVQLLAPNKLIVHFLEKIKTKAVAQNCSVNKVFFRSQACNFIKKEALTQVFSCQFCEISKNTFSYRTPPVTASVKTTHNYNNKINSNYLGEKLFLKNVYVIKVLAH